MTVEFKDLPLKQEMLSGYLDDFLTKNPKLALRDNKKEASKQTIKIGAVGHDDATVVLFFKTGGLTTIQYKTGKNHSLGLSFAEYLHSTIDENDSLTVNLILKGIDDSTRDTLLEDLDICKDDITLTRHSHHCGVRFEITSQYKDKLVVTHYNTQKLQIQGKALFCYRTLLYSLSILLDQESLLSVISKSNDEDKVLVREEVARVHIQNEYPNSFSKMDRIFQNLLVSSYCVKLASPDFSEYSMLLYADLRVLEGVIKKVLMLHHLHTDTARIDIGQYFNCTQSTTLIKNEYQSDFDTEEVKEGLEECYHFYRVQRHALFHISEIAGTSRAISSLTEVMRLSKDIAIRIDKMYLACNRL